MILNEKQISDEFQSEYLLGEIPFFLDVFLFVYPIDYSIVNRSTIKSILERTSSSVSQLRVYNPSRSFVFVEVHHTYVEKHLESKQSKIRPILLSLSSAYIFQFFI